MERIPQFIIDNWKDLFGGTGTAVVVALLAFFFTPLGDFIKGFFKKTEQADSPSADAAEQSAEITLPTERHYSQKDKDRISDAFHQLREVLNNKADPLQLEVQNISRGWSQKQSSPSDSPLHIENTIGRLATVRAEAARLSNVIFVVMLQENKSYEPLLKSVIAYRVPDPFRELYQHIDRVKRSLESVDADNLEKFNKSYAIETMVLILTHLNETNSRVNGWIFNTIQRLEEQEKLIFWKSH